MGMTCAGAIAETQKQIETVFHFPLNDPSIHHSLGMIQKEYSNISSNGIEIKMVNKLWTEQSYKINKSFVKKVKKDYSSAIDKVDFVNKPEDSRKRINSYIEQQTNGRIKDLLPDESINPLVRLVLTNAIYFKGDWSLKFDPKRTQEADFFISPEKKIKCKMMSLTWNFKFAERDDYKVIELPYKGENLSMIVLLPNEGIAIETFQKKLSYDFLQNMTEGLVGKEVWVKLPRFKSTSSYSLKSNLIGMGMPNPFSNNANFSNISPKDDLKIFDVYHKAFIEVNEQGTEAAAATAVVVGLKSVMLSYEFFANRPFIYYIKDTKSGLILFMGRLSNPTL